MGHEPSKADEVAFVDKIVEHLQAYQYLDLDRMYAIGYSNGAGMVNILAARTQHFRASANCATQLVVGQEPNQYTQPISIYIVSGTEDPIIPYEGGPTDIGHTYLPVKASAQLWADLFECLDSATVSFIGKDSLFQWTGCQAGREIRLHRVEGGRHDLNQNQDPEFYRRILNFLLAQ